MLIEPTSAAHLSIAARSLQPVMGRAAVPPPRPLPARGSPARVVRPVLSRGQDVYCFFKRLVCCEVQAAAYPGG